MRERELEKEGTPLAGKVTCMINTRIKHSGGEQLQKPGGNVSAAANIHVGLAKVTCD